MRLVSARIRETNLSREMPSPIRGDHLRHRISKIGEIYTESTLAVLSKKSRGIWAVESDSTRSRYSRLLVMHLDSQYIATPKLHRGAELRSRISMFLFT